MAIPLRSYHHLMVLCVTGGLLLALSACATVRLGHDFDISNFEARVVTGQSSRDDIRNWIGNPDSTGISVSASGVRSEKWGYYYGHGKLPGLKDAHLKMLEIEFDNQGQVHSYNWSQ